MSNTSVATDFQGLMGIVKKSKYPLQPVYEAVTNALEAILQKEYADEEKPEITITFDFTGLIEEVKKLERITLRDNDLGFNKKNYTRFKTLLDKSKGYHNRDSGRIQYVHRFKQIDIETFYEDDNKHYKRSFSYKSARFIYDHKNIDDKKTHTSGSVVILVAGGDLEQDQEYYDSLEIIDIVKDIKRQFLLRFYLGLKEDNHKLPIINIIFSNNSNEKERAVIKPEDMPQPSDTGELKVSHLKLKNIETYRSEKIEWRPVLDPLSGLTVVIFAVAKVSKEHGITRQSR